MIFLLALVPAVVFSAVLALAADGPATGDSGAMLILLLTFVVLPALIPLGAARTSTSRAVALGLLCLVAGISGFLVATTEDAQAGFAIFYNLILAPVIAVIVRLGERVLGEARTGRHEDSPSRGDRDNEWVAASAGDRLTALAVDVAVLWAICFVPGSALKDSGNQFEAAALVLVVGALYFGVSVFRWQRSFGQRVMDLAVVDADTFGPLSASRCALRGLSTTAVVGGSFLLLFTPLAIAELAAVAWFGGRSLTDRLVGTLVIARRPREAAVTQAAPKATD